MEPVSDQSKILMAAILSMSALVSASIGEVAVVFSRALALKHYALADIEWLVVPADLSGQFHVAQAAHKESGFRVPIAVATWAFVSEEVDQRLSSDLSRPPRRQNRRAMRLRNPQSLSRRLACGLSDWIRHMLMLRCPFVWSFAQ